MTTQTNVKLEMEISKHNISSLHSTIHPSHTQNQDPIDKVALAVEKVLDRKIEDNNKFYLLRWKNATNSEPVWEPIENLTKQMDTIIEYEVQRRVENPDLYYTKANIPGPIKTEKRQAEWDLRDKMLTRKQIKQESDKRDLKQSYFLNKRCKLVTNLGLEKWEDKNVLEEKSKKIKMSNPFTINPIRFRFRDIMRIENDTSHQCEYLQQYTPNKIAPRNQMRRFQTEIANRNTRGSNEKKQKRRPGRPRKIKLEPQEIDVSENNDTDSPEIRSEEVRKLIVEIENEDSEVEEFEIEEDVEVEIEDEEEEMEEIEETEEEEEEQEDDDDDDDDDEEYKVEKQVRRSRGRPPGALNRPRRVQEAKQRRPRGRPHRIISEEEQTESKPKKSMGRPRRILKKVKAVEGDDENKENRDANDYFSWPPRGKPFKIISDKKRRSPKIVEIKNETVMNHSDSEKEECGSLEDFETIVSQLRKQTTEEANRYEEPRRKRGKPRKELFLFGRQETQEKTDVASPGEVKQEGKDKVKNVDQELKDQVVGNESKTQNDVAGAKRGLQNPKEVDRIQKKVELVITSSESEIEDSEVNEKEKEIVEVKSMEKETVESKSKVGKESAASILDQMQEDLMNLESAVFNKVFDDDEIEK